MIFKHMPIQYICLFKISINQDSAACHGTSFTPPIPACSAHVSATSTPPPTVACPSAHFAPNPLLNPSAVDVEPPVASNPVWLPAEIKKTIPVQDQKWISAALWKHQRLRTDLKLWYDPPGPALIYHQAPTPERFFTHQLLLWMPYHLWKVRLSCPECGKQLTGAGVHKRARLVLDVDRYYLMITETLRCNSVGCKTNYISSSKTILDQLDLAHRLEFSMILTQK